MTQTHLKRPVRPGHIAVRKVAGSWHVLSPQRLPDFAATPRFTEPGLHAYGFGDRADLAHRVAREAARRLREYLAAEHDHAEACQ